MFTFCEKLTQKDKRWEDLLRRLSLTSKDHVMKVLMEVIGLLVLTFTKRNDESQFDRLLAEGPDSLSLRKNGISRLNRQTPDASGEP